MTVDELLTAIETHEKHQRELYEQYMEQNTEALRTLKRSEKEKQIMDALVTLLETLHGWRYSEEHHKWVPPQG